MACGTFFMIGNAKFCPAFLDVLRSTGIRPMAPTPRSPNPNAFAGRLVCTLRQEGLPKLILFGETSLRRALHEYIQQHHLSRTLNTNSRTVPLRDRLGGLLKFYCRVA